MVINIDLELQINEQILSYAIYRLIEVDKQMVTEENILKFIEWKTRLDIVDSLPPITRDYLDKLTPKIIEKINEYRYMIEKSSDKIELSDEVKLSDECRKQQSEYIEKCINTPRRSAWLNVKIEDPNPESLITEDKLS
jgi:hypothetical protein